VTMGLYSKCTRLWLQVTAACSNALRQHFFNVTLYDTVPLQLSDALCPMYSVTSDACDFSLSAMLASNSNCC
jgi:hypothetical protein